MISTNSVGLVDSPTCIYNALPDVYLIKNRLKRIRNIFISIPRNTTIGLIFFLNVEYFMYMHSATVIIVVLEASVLVKLCDIKW